MAKKKQPETPEEVYQNFYDWLVKRVEKMKADLRSMVRLNPDLAPEIDPKIKELDEAVSNAAKLMGIVK